MKLKCKISKTRYFILLIPFLIIVFFNIYSSTKNIPTYFNIVFFVGFILVLDMFIRHYIIMEEEGFTVKLGIFKTKVLYKDITKMQKIDSTGKSKCSFNNMPELLPWWDNIRRCMSLSPYFIDVYYNTKMGVVRVSPENEELFCQKILEHNENIIIDEAI